MSNQLSQDEFSKSLDNNIIYDGHIENVYELRSSQVGYQTESKFVDY